MSLRHWVNNIYNNFFNEHNKQQGNSQNAVRTSSYQGAGHFRSGYKDRQKPQYIAKMRIKRKKKRIADKRARKLNW